MEDPYYSTLRDTDSKNMEKDLELEEIHITVFYYLMKKFTKF